MSGRCPGQCIDSLACLTHSCLAAQPAAEGDMNISRYGFGCLSLCLTLATMGAQPLKFELMDRHQIVVRGAIGPLDGLRLLIDTGAIPSMVDRKIAKKLAVNVEGSEFVSFGKSNRVESTVLPDIRLGPLRAKGVPVGIGDLSFLHGVD